MHRNKKSHLMFYFLHKYRIPPTAMQLNALELVILHGVGIYATRYTA
jgi:hypothetical protein